MLPPGDDDYDAEWIPMGRSERLRALILLAFLASCCFAWAWPG